jgi:hypothetical protein
MRELFAPAFVIFNKRDIVATTNSRRRKWAAPGTRVDEFDKFHQKLKSFDDKARIYAAAHPTDAIAFAAQHAKSFSKAGCCAVPLARRFSKIWITLSHHSIHNREYLF